MKLRPPDTAPLDTGGRSRRGLILLVSVFVLINAMLLFLWLYHIKEQPQAPEIVQKNQLATDSSLTDRQNQGRSEQVPPDAAEAKQAHGQWLQAQAQAETLLLSVWANDVYEQAKDFARNGDEEFSRKQYRKASSSYNEATSTVTRILAKREEILAGLLQNGEAALEQGKKTDAVKFFEIILAVEPDNIEAHKGRQRAANSDKVSALLERAVLQLEDNQLTGADELVNEALRLDPENQRAAALSSVIEGKTREQAFTRAMSEFFSALDRDLFPEAEKILAGARQLKPESGVVRNAAAELKSKQKAVQVRKLERLYQQQVVAENWKAASKTIDQALLLDQQAGFAVQNRELVADRIKLDQRLELLLGDPLVLQDAARYDTAKSLVDYAKSRGALGPRLTAQIQALSTYILLARQETEVRLLSDNRTEITIYKIGRLGVFNTRSIGVTPGSYTIVGRRTGYRDVRKTLTVPITGSSSLTMTIVCEERI